MSCCGKKRANLPGSVPNLQSANSARRTSSFPAVANESTLSFEYVGGSAMTVVGPITGARYRFIGYGARVNVDPRDRLSLIAVPNLREVVQ